MKKLLCITMMLTLTTSVFAEITNWWGLVSFRQRFEEDKEYTDFTQTGEQGTLRYTDTNSKTRIGYQVGFIMDIHDNLQAAVTLRSGMGSVMWVDIDDEDRSKLAPDLQEAYLDWTTPYTRLEMGRIHQRGNALWDLYASAKLATTDPRLYNPTDGVFNDRMSALSGARLQVPVGPVTLRGIYHTDDTGGNLRAWESETVEDENDLDWYTFLVGAKAEYEGFELDFDYGFPKRVGNRYRVGTDSVYVDESIYGATLKYSNPDLFGMSAQIGYAHNDRDSVFASDFYDAILRFNVDPIADLFENFWILHYIAPPRNVNWTVRYQYGYQELKWDIYDGRNSKNSALHIYFNKEIWNLDVQPRIILFSTKIDDKDLREQMRLEVTTTVRF